MLNKLRAVFRPSAAQPCAETLPVADLELTDAPQAQSRPARVPPHMRHINRPIEEHLSVYQATRVVQSVDTGLATIERRRRRAA